MEIKIYEYLLPSASLMSKKLKKISNLMAFGRYVSKYKQLGIKNRLSNCFEFAIVICCIKKIDLTLFKNLDVSKILHTKNTD